MRMGVLGWGWASEFWTSGIIHMRILTINVSTVSVTQFGQKVD